MNRRLGLALGLALLLAACATPPDLPGPAIAAARLADDSFTTADGARLPLRRWLPAGAPHAVIVALHGFNDYRAAFDLPGPALAAAGIAVYAYDQRGFGAAPWPGRWPGTAALQDDLLSLLWQLSRRNPEVPLYVLGESMGGAVALTTLSRQAIEDGRCPPLAGVILVAPAVWSRAEMPWYQDAALWLASKSLPWLTLSGRGLHIQPSDNIEMLRRMSRDPLVIKETRIDAIAGLCDLMDAASLAAPRFDLPTLLLFGDKDDVVPQAARSVMLARLPPGMVSHLYPQGYHMLLRDLEAARPLADIIAWTGS